MGEVDSMAAVIFVVVTLLFVVIFTEGHDED